MTGANIAILASRLHTYGKNNHMDSDEILELVKDGVIEPEQVEDFEALDEEIQQLVADGDLDMDDVAGL